MHQGHQQGQMKNSRANLNNLLFTNHGNLNINRYVEICKNNQMHDFLKIQLNNMIHCTYVKKAERFLNENDLLTVFIMVPQNL